MLTEQGGVIDDLIVYYQDDEHYRMVVNAATREKDLAWIKQHAQTFNVVVSEREDLAMLAVQGPLARSKVSPLLPSNLQAAAMALAPFQATWNNESHFFVGRTGYTGEDGFEIILPGEQASAFWEALLQAQVQPIGLGARDTLRLEAGMNLYGSDMDENYTPLESGLAWTVAWLPLEREFIGRQALQVQHDTGKHRQLVGLILLDKGVLRAHQQVITKQGEIGEITSGTFSPSLGIAIALARLPAGNYEQVHVTIRNKHLSAQVVKPPFVRQGKACIKLPKS
jgi:aminomethyltransferase